MKSILVLILVLIFSSMTVFACSSGDDFENVNEGITKTDEYDNIIRANKDFAFDIFKSITNDEKDKNVFISPISLTFALSMVYNGAGGQTAGNMSETMNINGIDLDKLNDSMLYLKYKLSKTKQSKVSIANSLWANNQITFKDKFKTDMSKYYKAEIEELDFSDPKSPDVINKWVKDSTNGMIEKMVEQMTPQEILYLMNAIYFKGTWTKEFDKEHTYEKDFHKTDGSTSKIKMMTKSGVELIYTNNDKYKAVRLPYGEDERLGLIMILPSRDSNINNLLKDFNSKEYKKLSDNMNKQELENLIIPKFKMRYKRDLIGDLQSLGMTLPFTDSADFTGLTELQNILISKVFQKAVIDINEEGTEASAVTSITIKMTSAPMNDDPIEFIADRPFMFILNDKDTDTILFMGVFNDPDNLG